LDCKLELVIIPVTDIDQAHAELTGRGVAATEVFHFEQGGQTSQRDSSGHSPAVSGTPFMSRIVAPAAARASFEAR
jgi:hypothetical protein